MASQDVSADERVLAYLDSGGGPAEEIIALIQEQHLEVTTHLDFVSRFVWERWDTGAYAARVVSDYGGTGSWEAAADILFALLKNPRAYRNHEYFDALVRVPSDIGRSRAEPYLSDLVAAARRTESGGTLAHLDVNAPLGGVGDKNSPTDLYYIWHDAMSVRQELYDQGLPVQVSGALLGLVYRDSPSTGVPEGLFWALLDDMPGHRLFFELLHHRQTSRMMFRWFTSTSWRSVSSAFKVPSGAGVAHAIGALATFPDARVYGRLWNVVPYGWQPGPAALPDLVEAAETTLFRLGRQPIRFEDNDLRALTLRAIAHLIRIGSEKTSEKADAALLARLRGIESQIDLIWPRVLGVDRVTRDADEAWRLSLRKLGADQLNPVSTYCWNEHPSNDIRTASLKLGDVEGHEMYGRGAVAEAEANYEARRSPSAMPSGAWQWVYSKGYREAAGITMDPEDTLLPGKPNTRAITLHYPDGTQRTVPYP